MCMRARAEPSRAEPRTRLAGACALRASRLPSRFTPSPCVYRPLPYTASAYALTPNESERNREREEERDKRHTIVSQSWIIQACVHGPTHHSFLLTRCVCVNYSIFFFRYGPSRLRMISRDAHPYFMLDRKCFLWSRSRLERRETEGRFTSFETFPVISPSHGFPITIFNLDFGSLAMTCARIQAARCRNSLILQTFVSRRISFKNISNYF